MMHKIPSSVLALIILALFGTNPTIAQIWIDNQAIYNEANGYIEGEEFEEAIPLLKLLDRKGVTNANIDYKLGLCYINIAGSSIQSIPYLESAALSSSSEYIDDLKEVYAPLDAWLKLGIAYRINNDLENAELCFLAYKDSVEGKDEEQLVDFYLSQLENATFFKNNPSNNQLVKVKHNSNYSVYNPVVTSGTSIYYMEARPFYNAVIEGTFEDNYIVEKENLIPQIGSEEDLKLLSVSPDEQILLFSTYIIGKGDELLISQKDKSGNWNKYEFFKEPINSPSNEKFASISATGEELFFSSNRPGGYGGNDIYVSKKTEKGWSEPENLGYQVNSPFNEELCYISADGQTLYLSSEGHLNMGGYDFFVSVKDADGKWSVPSNLGVPVSTTDDDKFLSVSPKGELYTSRFNTNQVEKQEVYRIELHPEAYNKQVLVTSQLSFNQELPAKEVSYIITLIDSNKVVKRSATSKNGKAMNLLGVGAYLFDYVYDNTAQARQKIVITDDLATDELVLESPKWERPEQKIKATKEQIVIRDVLFEFDSYKITDQYNNMLDSIARLLIAHSNFKAIIEGHTDAIGSKKYNQMLSQKRAQAVGNYLNQRGVISSAIHVVGMGEDTPVAINKNSDGTDSSEGRKYNRRVSIYVKNNKDEVLIVRSLLIPKSLVLDK